MARLIYSVIASLDGYIEDVSRSGASRRRQLSANATTITAAAGQCREQRDRRNGLTNGEVGPYTRPCSRQCASFAARRAVSSPSR